MKNQLCKEERRFIRHALGLNNGQRVGYRNRYLAGGLAIGIGDSLASRGLARRTGYSSDVGVWFVITEAGFEAVKNKGERMDREELAFMRGLGSIKSHEGQPA